MHNEYLPFVSEVLDVIKHTDIEYTFRMSFKGNVKPGQFFEVSIPKFGEAPISVSGIGEDYVDLTIRKVGKVTNEVFTKYKGEEVVIVAGGTGLSPVKGIVDYFSKNPQDATSTRVIAGFKSPKDMLFKEDMKEWEKNINFTLTVDSAEEGYEGNVGLVTKYIPELKFEDMDTAQVIVVGPPMMMKFTVAEFLKLGMKEENIWISHERKMCCGLGKCGHCRIDDTYVCLDGPVFNYSKGKLLRD